MATSENTSANYHTDSSKISNPVAALNPDSTKNKNNFHANPIPSDTLKAPAKKWDIALLAGGNITVPRIGLAPMGGILLSRDITEKWEISSGVFYNPVYPLLYRNTTYQDKDLGLGEIRFGIEYRRLQYASIPLFVSYHCGEKNSFSAGVNFQKFFSAKGEIIIDTIPQEGRSTGTDYMMGGLHHGINDYDWQLLFGYERNFSDKFSCGIFFHYGMTDISQNSVFIDPAKDRTSAIQFRLKYNLYSF